MNKSYDYIIIGAGPAGLQMAYFLKKQQHDYLILEKGITPGTFFETFPRHETLISINKVFTGYEDDAINFRWDWNSLRSDELSPLFKNYSKKYLPHRTDLLKYLKDYASEHDLAIQYNSHVKRILKKEAIFEIHLLSGEIFYAKRLIIGTGVSLPYVPDITGIEHAKTYFDMSMDKKGYENKRMLIIGKGNSGFETADHFIDVASLIHIASPNPLQMAWKTHYVGHLRAVNNNILDTYQLKLQNAVINADIKKIECINDKYRVFYAYKFANQECESIEYDAIILCTGFKFDNRIFDTSCMPELAINDRFPKMTSYYESTNIKDLYFIGTLMQQRDYKKKQSGFIHGFRSNIQFLSHYLESRYYHKDFSSKKIKSTANEMTRIIIKRINESASLWQQTGFLCDALVVNNGSESFYYERLPVDFAHEANFLWGKHYFLMTLEFGQERIDSFPDIFNIPRVNKKDYKNAHLSTFLHPVIRHYHGGRCLSTHHIIEDFEGVWREREHIEPLKSYFTQELRNIIIKLVSA